MRIISGKNKGRKIIPPQHLPVRPTTDLGKESLLNILNNYFFFEQVTVLDLFAGTGNISLEFASRGAQQVIAVDNFSACVAFISKMCNTLQYNNLTVLRADAFQFVKRCRQSFDIIFADPPYDMEGLEIIVNEVFKNNLLKKDGWLILEHSKNHDFSAHPNFFEHRKYGKLNFTFLVNNIESVE